jgi:3',5'-cyclic AMP phosphodiesterase CpdA
MSDLHAGPPFRPEVAEAAARQAHDLRPDLLIISGDFVQRAIFSQQWQAVTAYLETLPQPRLVVPGNHDVPLFDGFSRIFAPLRYYHRHISPDTSQIFERPGLAVIGANSAHGLTLDGGLVHQQQLAALEQQLQQFGPDTCKVVVMHHPIVKPVASHKGEIRNARAVRQVLERCEVELYLCGHIHYSLIELLASDNGLPDTIVTERRGIIISQSGTTTSRRGRGTDRAKNSFNVIRIDAQSISIQPYFYMPESGQFEPTEARNFTRHHSADTPTS